jgi:hypothetical protein
MTKLSKEKATKNYDEIIVTVSAIVFFVSLMALIVFFLFLVKDTAPSIIEVLKTNTGDYK